MNPFIIQKSGLRHTVLFLCALCLTAGTNAWGQSEEEVKGYAENIFVTAEQGNGNGEAGNPAPVGNQKNWETSGIYDENHNVTILTDLGEPYQKVSYFVNGWITSNLTGQAPMAWDEDILNAETPISIDRLNLLKAVAFDPRITLLINGYLSLNNEEKNSSVLPKLILLNDYSSEDRVSVSSMHPNVIASAEELTVRFKLPKKSVDVIYANVSMPFLYTTTKGIPKTFFTYDGAHRAEYGTAGQTNWKSVDGKNWLIPLQDEALSVSFSINDNDAILAAIHRDDNNVTLKYDYDVNPANKPGHWPAAHFGWNVVNNGFTYDKSIAFSDKDINVIQYLADDGGYKTIEAREPDHDFRMSIYTAYFVQATNDNTNGTLRSDNAKAPLSEAVLELLSADGTVLDCVLATAADALPGRNVQKMGVAKRNIYIDKEGMKCAATDVAGVFPIRVTGTSMNLRLARVANGVTATWDGVPLQVGETVAATDGTLCLTGIPTGTESADMPLFRASGTTGALFIEGPADGTDYRVTAMGGVSVASGKLTESQVRVPVALPGIYIVAVGGQNIKVVVK